MSVIKVYHRFELPKGKGIKCDPSEGKTHQSFKDECDVNAIVDRYAKTGLWGSSLKPGDRQPLFGDFSNAPDFREAMDKINQANSDFANLPSRLRKRFNNDPAELLAFLSDPKNTDEAIAIGLCEKKSAPAAPAPPVADGAQSPKAN